MLSASVIAVMSWKDVTIFPLFTCQGVWNKTCTQLSLFQILFQYLKNYSLLGKFQDSASTLDAIRRSFLTKSATAAMFTSVWVDFGWPPLSSSSTSSLPYGNREYQRKTFDRLTASFPYAFYTSTSVSVADRLALKQNFMATPCSFPPSMTYKENWLCKL
jgi:hypothetical protein